MKKSAKIITATLAAITVIFAAMAITVSADTETKPEIISQNVAYAGDFALMYAVDPATVTAPVTLNIYEEAPTETSTAKYTFTSSATTPAETSGLDIDAYIFIANGTAAKDLTKVYYAQVVGADGTKSDVKRYSVTEYLYERLADSTITAKQEALYESVIDFGDKAIDLLATGNPLVSDYSYVTIKNGTLADGYTAGIYTTGSTLTYTADTGVKKWIVSNYAANGTKTANIVAATETTAKATGRRTEITGSYVVPYDFNSLTLNSTTVSGWMGKGTFAPKNINDSVYGTTSRVLQLTNTADNSMATFYHSATKTTGTTKVEAADATALEISFDLKITPTATPAVDTIYRLSIQGVNSAVSTENKVFYQYGIGYRASNGSINIYNQATNSKQSYYVYNTEYNNLTFRFYLVDKLVDGEIVKEQVVDLYGNGVYLGSMSDIVNAQYNFSHYSKATLTATSTNAYICLDNVFTGFVKE